MGARAHPRPETPLVAARARRDPARARRGSVPAPHRRDPTRGDDRGPHLVAGGSNIAYVQRLLGHRSLETTQIYTRVAVPEVKATFRRSHPRARVSMKRVACDVQRLKGSCA
ncbi:MAG: hypothetical protein B7X11_06270 [Acidobacteria bacterium 37-65-4]|nr:MAG: hypothetical protein B7X11_06270 [Acidobacteria bacterium 37-65-4]